MPTNFTLRLRADLREMLNGVASKHGRAPGAEARIAVELHCVRVLLRECEDASSGARGLGDPTALARFKRRLEADLAHLEHVANAGPSSSAMYVQIREAPATD